MLTDARTRIDAAVDRDATSWPVASLHAPMRHAVAGGKRVRGALVNDVATTVSDHKVDAMHCAIAYEYLHAASLVVDDMPHFDNDLQRRGEPAVHAAYGCATAQMTAAALCAMATRAVAAQTEQLVAASHPLTYASVASCSSRVLANISRAIASASQGQIDEKRVSSNACSVAYKKTAAMFATAVLCAFDVGNALLVVKRGNRDLVERAATCYGMAYQFVDDLTDQDTDDLDANVAATLGRHHTIILARRFLGTSESILRATELWSPIWADATQLLHAKLDVF